MQEPSVLEQDVSAVVRSVMDFQERFSLLSIDNIIIHAADDAAIEKGREALILSCLQRHLGLLIEEVGEVSKAVNHGDAEAAIQELLDVLYITISSIYTMGEAQIGKALPGLLEKNDSKTPETHEMHPITWKLIRKGA